MHKISYVLAERFSQDPLETYFCKQHPRGAWKDNLLFYDFGYANTFWNQKFRAAIRYQAIKPTQQVIPYSFHSHSIFHSFTTSLINVCFVVMKNIFNQYIKKLLNRETAYFIIFQCLVKIPSGKMSFLSHPGIQLAVNHTGLYLSSVKKKLYGPFLWMGFNCLKARATSRRQFTFYHSVPRNSWYSFNRPQKDSHPVVLNTGPLNPAP